MILRNFSYKAGDSIAVTTATYSILIGINITQYELEFFIPLDRLIIASNVAVSMSTGYIRSYGGFGALDISKLTDISATKCVGGIRVHTTFSTAQFTAGQQSFAVTFNGYITFS